MLHVYRCSVKIYKIYKVFFDLLQFGQGFRVWQTKGAQAGKPEITNQLRPDGSFWYEPCGTAVLYRNGNTLVACFRAAKGTICCKQTWRGRSINVDVWVPRVYATRTRGILGNFDGDPCNDYIDRSENRLPDICNPHSSERDIYDRMKSCKSTNYN